MTWIEAASQSPMGAAIRICEIYPAIEIIRYRDGFTRGIKYNRHRHKIADLVFTVHEADEQSQYTDWYPMGASGK